MSKVKLLPEAHDGIQEYDNGVPGWLSLLFIVCILYGVYYAVIYPSFWFYDGTSGWSQVQQHDDLLAAHNEKYNLNEEFSWPESFLTDEDSLLSGADIYQTRCASCHLKDGSGQVGPSFLDDEWLYGSSLADMGNTISEGTSNGMIAHKTILSTDEIVQVASYVHKLNQDSLGK